MHEDDPPAPWAASMFDSFAVVARKCGRRLSGPPLRHAARGLSATLNDCPSNAASRKPYTTPFCSRSTCCALPTTDCVATT